MVTTQLSTNNLASLSSASFPGKQAIVDEFISRDLDKNIYYVDASGSELTDSWTNGNDTVVIEIHNDSTVSALILGAVAVEHKATKFSYSVVDNHILVRISWADK